MKTDFGEAVGALQSHLHEAVARRATERIFVHSGVVGWRGKAILLPGRSGSGKSTLTMALVDAGATYYSDEYAVLDSDGLVHPFRRLPQLRSPLGRNTAQNLTAELDGASGDFQPLPAGLILLSKFRNQAKWHPQSLTTGQALLGLVRNTVAIRRQPEISMVALVRAAAQARAYRTVRAEAAEAARVILQLCESEYIDLEGREEN